MGTWDIGFFDNDMACDWENEIKKDMDLEYIEITLLPILEGEDQTSDDDLDIDLTNRGLAAADALARLMGIDREKSSYTKHIDAWAENFTGEVPESLKKLAIDVLEKIKSNDSEIHLFWKIRGMETEWIDSITALQDQLKGN